MRARYGDGSVFRYGQDRFGIQYYVDDYDEHGHKKRKRIREYGFEDFDSAQKQLHKQLHKAAENTWEKPDHPVTITELFLAWQRKKKANPQKMRPRELSGRWKHLEPIFGRMPAARLTPDHVLEYRLQRKAEHAADATINRELCTLRSALRYGMKCRKIQTVPYIETTKENNVRKGFIKAPDFMRLTAATSELYPKDHWLRTLLELAFTYGWRRSELFGLKVSQIDLEDGTIYLNPGETKNDDARIVSMTANVRELLRVAIDGKRPEDLVLTRNRKRPIVDFRGKWARICVLAELGKWICRVCGKMPTGEECPCGSRLEQWKYRGMLLHDFRRSAAKALRSAGVPESVIMKTGGWKTAEMFRRYAIVDKDDQRKAIEMLEQARSQEELTRKLKAGNWPVSAARAQQGGTTKVQ